jgi:ABC-type bacteriocin/lantibiotic exporter with double-glycine peptidase domain
MKLTKELIAGIIFILLVVLLVWWIGGKLGLLRVGIAVLVAWIALYFLNKRSILSKKGVMNQKPDLLVRFLMPRKYREAIKELEETEKKE